MYPKNVKMLPLEQRLKMRSSNYGSLSPREQWEQDKELGLLDWDGKSLDPPASEMPVANVIPTAFEIFCPGCGDHIPHPSGSLFWTAEEMPAQPRLEVWTCKTCNLKFKLP